MILVGRVAVGGVELVKAVEVINELNSEQVPNQLALLLQEFILQY